MFSILLFLFSAHCILTTSGLTCNENEVIDDCPSNCTLYSCPTCDEPAQECSKPDPCPLPICKCRFNYLRAANGECIPTRECPAFECSDPNAVYNSCPPYCPNGSCSQATPTGKCPLPGKIGIVVECRPTCRCREGYWKNDGICVPYEQCPQNEE